MLMCENAFVPEHTEKQICIRCSKKTKRFHMLDVPETMCCKTINYSALQWRLWYVIFVKIQSNPGLVLTICNKSNYHHGTLPTSRCVLPVTWRSSLLSWKFHYISFDSWASCVKPNRNLSDQCEQLSNASSNIPTQPQRQHMSHWTLTQVPLHTNTSFTISVRRGTCCATMDIPLTSHLSKAPPWDIR